MFVFCVVSCSLAKVYWHFTAVCCLSKGNDDESRKHLWNISKLLPDNVAQQASRQSSSYSLLQEPLVSHMLVLYRKYQQHHKVLAMILLSILNKTYVINSPDTRILQLRNKPYPRHRTYKPWLRCVSRLKQSFTTIRPQTEEA
jgi:hypothetical protein